MQKNERPTATHAAQDKGFYIILILCVAAIAISGYVLFFAPLSGSKNMQSVEYTPNNAVQEDTRTQVNAETPTAVTTPPAEKPAEPAKPSAEPAPEEKAESPKKTAAQKPVWVQPVRGEVAQGWSGDQLVYHKTFGDWRVHDGVDYLASSGTRVYAVANGTVSAVDQDPLWGTCVTITLDDERTAVYRGLSENPKVKKDSTVKAGDVIGSVASVLPAEADIGAHLHFELRDKDGTSVDPAKATAENE